MGKASGSNLEGPEKSANRGWRKDDPGSSDKLRAFLEGGEGTRFKQKYPTPCAGDRFGEFTAVGPVEYRGPSRVVLCACSCGSEHQWVYLSNLAGGKSTRCNTCAKKKSQRTRQTKYFWKYEAAMPDTEHRRRLLNRLSAARGRCENESNRMFRNYGGRGIQVCQEWKDDPAAFLLHVQTLPGWDDPSLEMDRTDCNKGYAPGNLRFVSRSENMANKRKVPEMQAEIDALRAALSALGGSI